MQNKYVMYLMGAVLVCDMHVGFAADLGRDWKAYLYNYSDARFNPLNAKQLRQDAFGQALRIFDGSSAEMQLSMLNSTDQYGATFMTLAVRFGTVSEVRHLTERYEKHHLDIRNIKVLVKEDHEVTFLQLAYRTQVENEDLGRTEVIEYLRPMFFREIPEGKQQEEPEEKR
ncbi:MAG TPA: hypothetical protein VGT41_03555 [Candidatus Babeliales bacterium]|nr:hypothetical protein [Candidatus Babeliales bacterium]